MPRDVIDATALHAALAARPETVVLDCRFDLRAPEAGRRAYEAGHIPGARYADLDRDLARLPEAHEGRHPLPAPDAFATTLGRLGVTRSSPVVAYDDAGGAFAARAWWLLRWLGHDEVAVLDGGLPAWQRAGLALEQGRAEAPVTTYAPWRADDTLSVATDEIEALQAAGHVVLDARAPARFRGEVEPIDPIAGHVPGAVNLPFDRYLDADACLAAPDDVGRVLEAVLGGRSAVTMCGSGVTACHLLLAMAHAGLPPGRLYVGSWSEWIRDPGRPIATGD